MTGQCVEAQVRHFELSSQVITSSKCLC